MIRRLAAVAAALLVAIVALGAIVPTRAWAATVTIDLDENGKPTAASGDGWRYDQSTDTLDLDSSGYSFTVATTCTSKVTNADGGDIVGGTWSGDVYVAMSDIDGGTFTGAVDNAGDIDGGTFSGSVTNGCVIMGGTFECPVTCINTSILRGSQYYPSGTHINYPVTYKDSSNAIPGPYLYWGVTNSLTNITTDNSSTSAVSNATYTEKLTATNGVELPQIITVTMNGVAATAGTDYTWDASKGELSIGVPTVREKMGPIVVTAAGVASHALAVTYVGPADGTFVAPANATSTVIEGDVYSVTSPAVAGYTPDQASVSGTMGVSDVSITVTYAPNTYAVAFDANGGGGTMASQAMSYGVEASLAANSLTRDGYAFAGWNTAADGSGTAYADKATVENLVAAEGATVTLYAQWTKSATPVTPVAATATPATGDGSPVEVACGLAAAGLAITTLGRKAREN